MKADLSRLTFDPLAGFVRVVQQQGRPLLDADWNEQSSILLHRLHRLGRDLIGPHGGPSEHCGFEINGIDGGPLDFQIGAGRYYVNGVCCENPEATRFSTQPIPLADPGVQNGKTYLIFLDVWEELVAPGELLDLMEPALGGLDTALRTRVGWQVRAQEVAPDTDEKFVRENWSVLVGKWEAANRGCLRARIAPESEQVLPDPKFADPSPRYRGPENQLYRIEIHGGGGGAGDTQGATFKWSRENGSAVFALSAIRDEKVLVLDRLDAGGGSAILPGDWLETLAAGGGHYSIQREKLIRVVGRGTGRDEVVVDPATLPGALDLKRAGGLWVRRWDQKPVVANKGGGAALRGGAVPVIEATGRAGWIAIEGGIEVQFAPGASYRPGDYWLIPARVAGDGRLLWPGAADGPAGIEPYGVDHDYAPLAIVAFTPIASFKYSCRRGFRSIATTAI